MGTEWGRRKVIKSDKTNKTKDIKYPETTVFCGFFDQI
jgi:hypothetical protein